MTKKQIITKDINISELISKYPHLAEVLVEDYGLHCIGCYAAAFDSLEDGAKIHGFDDIQIKEMVIKLNKIHEDEMKKNKA